MKNHYVMTLALTTMIFAACNSLGEDPHFAAGLVEITVANQIDGIVGSYEKDGNSIRFRAKKELADTFSNGNLDSGYIISAQILDEDGNAFINKIGGNALPVEWRDEEREDRQEIDVEKRRREFELAAELGQVLTIVSDHYDGQANTPHVILPSHFDSDEMTLELERLIRLSYNTISEVEDNPAAEYVVEQSDLNDWEEGSSAQISSRGGPYTHRISLYFGERYIGVFIWEHSATKITTERNGQILNTWEYDNHGWGWDHSLMHYKCSRAYSGRSNYTPTGSNCATPYSVFSKSGHHNCNDDSTLQLKNVRYNRYFNPRGGLCDNGGSHFTAPSCSYNPSWPDPQECHGYCGHVCCDKANQTCCEPGVCVNTGICP